MFLRKENKIILHCGNECNIILPWLIDNLFLIESCPYLQQIFEKGRRNGYCHQIVFLVWILEFYFLMNFAVFKCATHDTVNTNKYTIYQ